MFDPTEPGTLTGISLRAVRDDVAYAIAASLKDILECDVAMVNAYAGAVYDRKGYVSEGTVSHKLDKSPYRNDGDLHYVLRIEVVIPEYMQEASSTKELFSRIAEGEEETERTRLEEHRQAALRKAAELREQAAVLENEARKLESQ